MSIPVSSCFFSSRRRHTILQGDWSSDVCSSDLGDLAAQAVQRFATMEDLDLQQCAIEEREEDEPHIHQGTVVYAGVDYEKILRQAEKEADVILWDGGNNEIT